MGAKVGRKAHVLMPAIVPLLALRSRDAAHTDVPLLVLVLVLVLSTCPSIAGGTEHCQAARLLARSLLSEICPFGQANLPCSQLLG
jgi:hypothetical protein